MRGRFRPAGGYDIQDRRPYRHGEPCRPALGRRPAHRPSTKLVEWLDPPRDFNLRHFRTRHLAAELIRTLRGDGVPLGRAAPDLALEASRGERLRLDERRGRPVLRHCVSYT